MTARDGSWPEAPLRISRKQIVDFLVLIRIKQGDIRPPVP
jgi:hypothetical protein